MLPLHRAYVLIVALATGLAGLWLLLVAVPELIDRHRDGALGAALVLLAVVPAGLAWGASRLRALLDPGDTLDDR